MEAGKKYLGKGVVSVDLCGGEGEGYNIVKDKEITLEMCLTSNIQTKAIDTYENHAFYSFFNDGIRVTVNTDNRTVSNTNMTKGCEVLFN